MAMKDPLAKLFGSVGRVKIMRLFLASPESCLTPEDVIRNTKTIKTTVTKELKLLESVDFITKTKCDQVGKKGKVTKKSGFMLNKEFEYLQTLRPLLTQVAGEQSADLAKKIRKTGRIKAVIVSGVFLQATNTRADLIIVGDAIQSRGLESVIRAAEAELGQELRYALFGSNEFTYRYDMHDRLICDILDGPHKKLVDRIGL